MLTMLNEVDVQIDGINVLAITANEALERIQLAKTMVFVNLFPDEEAARREELFKIAHFILTGNNEVKPGEVEVFKDSDIPFLSQQQVIDRFKKLETKINQIFKLQDLENIARFALTGVPF